MIEGKRVVAGEAILSGVTTDREARSTAERRAPTNARSARAGTLAARLSHRLRRAAPPPRRRRCHPGNVSCACCATARSWRRWRIRRRGWHALRGGSRWIEASGTRAITRLLSTILKDRDGNCIVDASADETIHGAQLSATLEKLIAALPTKLREPLMLSTIEEMTPREVAATLDINEAAVRSRVFRARQMLKEKLALATNGRNR